MRIVTWNINGIRSLKQHVKEILKDFDSDIVCFQETKISRSLLPEETALIDGYSSYFSFAKWQSGYSGVATYCQDSCTPTKAEEGLCGNSTSPDKHSTIGNSTFSDIISDFTFDLNSLDNEGRVVITQHELKNGSNIEKLVVINVYCPRVDCEKPERKVYKMQFCQLLEARAKSLVQDGYHVVIVGDLNIAHQPIDHCDPGDEKEFKAREARVWLTSFLDSEVCENGSNAEKDPHKFVDVFRFLHPSEKGAYTCWNTLTGARQTNYGTRIDYILSNKGFLPFVTSCEILSSVFGSDHCPVKATFCCEPLPSSQLPSLCCRLWPEFAGQQQKLVNFLIKSSSELNDEVINKRKTSEIPMPQKEKKKKKANGTQKQKAITNFFSNNRATKVDNFFSNKHSENSCRKENDEIQTEIFDSENYDKKSGDGCIESMSCQTEVPSSSANNNENDRGGEMNFSSNKIQSEMWKRVLCGPPPPPLCKGHGKACVLRTVRKEGLNFGRQFFACSQPNGHVSNPESSCNFFQWATPSKVSILKK